MFEFINTIGPLVDPTAHGGKAEDAFHVVIPSLPGYGFSGKPTAAGWGLPHIARGAVSVIPLCLAEAHGRRILPP